LNYRINSVPNVFTSCLLHWMACPLNDSAAPLSPDRAPAAALVRQQCQRCHSCAGLMSRSSFVVYAASVESSQLTRLYAGFAALNTNVDAVQNLTDQRRCSTEFDRHIRILMTFNIMAWFPPIVYSEWPRNSSKQNLNGWFDHFDGLGKVQFQAFVFTPVWGSQVLAAIRHLPGCRCWATPTLWIKCRWASEHRGQNRRCRLAAVFALVCPARVFAALPQGRDTCSITPDHSIEAIVLFLSHTCAKTHTQTFFLCLVSSLSRIYIWLAISLSLRECRGACRGNVSTWSQCLNLVPR